jgi:nitroreductase
LILPNISQEDLANAVDGVITSRKSTRAFLPTHIPHETITQILQVAARAPSGSNIQPWKVYVLTGEKKKYLSQKILEVFFDPATNALQRPEYIYYPKNWVEPFISRRRKVGFDLYKILGIGRGETEQMQKQHAKNFDFFGAPVGLVLTIPRTMEQGSWLDYGMFIQNILISAQAHGIQTCPQAAFISYHQIVAEVVGFPSDEQLVCCISMGYADPNAIENQLVTERVETAEFVKFVED